MSNIELLRRLVRDQTTSVGPVRNLIGPTAELATRVVTTAPATWLLLRIPGSALVPAPSDFYAAYSTSEDRASLSLVADQGVILVQHTMPAVFVLRGLVTLADTTSIPITITTDSAQGAFAFYVDGIQARRSSGDRDFSLLLAPGSHLLECMISSMAFAVQFPASLAVSSVREVLEAPIWESVTPGYADPLTGVSANLLRWYNDARVGGWSVLRRAVTGRGLIVTVGPADNARMFGIEVAGDIAAFVQVGTVLYAGFESIGTVADVLYDPSQQVTYDAVLYTGITAIRLTLPTEVVSTNPYWAGRQAGTGTFQEVQRVQRSGSQGTIEWLDTGVQTGVAYEYVLQAYGLFDAASLSPLSAVEYVRAGDTTAPGPIVVLAGYPQVVDDRISVVFTTPSDDDYVGVRTYFVETLQTSTSPGGNTATTFVLASTPVGPVTDTFVQVISGPGESEVLPVLSNAGATLTMDGTWATTPTSASQYQFYYRRAVITDYGRPNSADQFSFLRLRKADTTVRYGDYYFLTFDQAGNEQFDAAGVLWTYEAADDQTVVSNQAPVVGLRQLAVAEQQLAFPIPSPYNDTLNYAVVELTGSDPIDGTTGVTLQYRRRNIEEGTSTGTNGLDTLRDTTKTWAGNQWINYLLELTGGTGAGQSSTVILNGTNNLTVSPPFAVAPDVTTTYAMSWVAGMPATAAAVGADEPRMTRSRYVPVTREENENWIQARARDQDLVYSTALSYSPDFDANPEVSSVVVRVDPLANMVYVEGAVDDDARSLSWWVTPQVGAEPYSSATATVINNLEQIKDFAFKFSLTDGQRRVVNLRPWSALGGTGREGIDYSQEVYRTPRTSVVFENKTLTGGVSAETATATFLVSPAILDAESSTLTSATATTLVNSAAAWDPSGQGQWAEIPSAYQVYYVRLTSGAGINQVRKILSNSPTQLTITPDWTVIPAASTSYTIQKGATLYRVLSHPASQDPFRATATPVELSRTDADQYVEFHSVLTGAPPEEVHRAILDQDTVAEILDWTLVENDTSDLIVSILDWDDDVRRWQLFAKKGGWPTDNGAETGLVDLDYRRVDVSITTATSIKFNVGVGTWYCILVPLNSAGEAGPRLTDSLVVTGTEPAIGVLSSFVVSANDNGAVVYNKIKWSHNSVLDSGTGYTVKVYAYRQDLGVGTQAEVTSGLTRYPYLDVGVNFVNSDDTSSVGTEGSILHSIPGYLRAGAGSVNRTWVYAIDLLQASTVIQTQVINATDLYRPSEPGFSAAATSAILNAGSCVAGLL